MEKKTTEKTPAWVVQDTGTTGPEPKSETIIFDRHSAMNNVEDIEDTPESAERNAYDVLKKIQQELKVPKSRVNTFSSSKYHYRSLEDILEAVKPILKKYGACLTISDSLEEIGGAVYVKATATLAVGHWSVWSTAYARESETGGGMSSPQLTGAASSYARKYALNGLLLIDDTKDPDTPEYSEAEAKRREKAAENPQEYKCAICGKDVPEDIARKSIRKYGVVLDSKECAEKWKIKVDYSAIKEEEANSNVK